METEPERKSKTYQGDEFDPTVVREEWFELDGEIHRIGGPATFFYEDDVLVGEYFYAGGVQHRLEGPAVTLYDRDGTGQVMVESYAVNGRLYDSRAAFETELDRLPPSEQQEAVERSPFAPLLEEGVSAEMVIAVVRENGLRTAEGVREVLGGAPVEWVRSYESARS